MALSGWIGVDLDGTLAHYGGWKGAYHIGEPIPKMVERVKKWLAEGSEVRVFTARVGMTEKGEDTAEFTAQQTALIQDWCEKHVGQRLNVTATKDLAMIELYDDRCVQVIVNTGELVRAYGIER